MTIPFSKMNGAGNDFIVLDNRSLTLTLSKETIAKLCNRQRGIGADGLLCVEPAQGEGDFRFRYYNADGGEAEMCGNGARCFARFTRLLIETEKNTTPHSLSFETIAGLITATFLGDSIRLIMSIPQDISLNRKLEGIPFPVHSINTGVPHAVCFVPDIQSIDVKSIGQAIRQHPAFSPQGTNANFVQELNQKHLALRTYERGVEDETLACGTGMVASCLIHHLLHNAPSPIRIDVAGGETLEVAFQQTNNNFQKVTLTGPAEITFTGEITL